MKNCEAAKIIANSLAV